MPSPRRQCSPSASPDCAILQLAATAASIPLGRLSVTRRVAEWVMFLASPAAGFMTGQTVSVNGGRFMA